MKPGLKTYINNCLTNLVIFVVIFSSLVCPMTSSRAATISITDDTFTDTTGTALENHTGETGAVYTQIMGTPGMSVITSENKLRASSTGIAEYLASGIPASADYQVQANLTVKSIVDEGLYGVIGRSSADGQTQYIARYNAYPTNLGWELYVHNGGANYTRLGFAPQGLNVGQTYVLKLVMQGSSVQVYVDGVLVIDVTDSTISTAGQAGIEIGYQEQGAVPSEETGISMDNFVTIQEETLPVTTIVDDTFTDTTGTALENHTGETGAVYTQIMGTPGMSVITSENKLRASSTGIAEYLASGIPASADYQVQANLTVKSIVDEGLYGVIGRSSADGQTQYIARYNAYSAIKAWELYVHNGGANYARLGFVPQDLNVGQTYTLKMLLSSDNIKVYVNNGLVINLNDSSIAAAGQAGIEIGYQEQGAVPSEETGIAMDNFLVANGDLLVNDSNVFVDDPGLFFSPYNWRKIDNSYAITQTPGAYIKTVFTGTSLKINLSEDLLVSNAVSSGYYPRIRYKIDNQAEVEVQLDASVSTLVAATGLEPGNHDLLITFPHVGGGEVAQPDRWNVPVHGIKFLGLTIDEGASVALPTLRPKRMLVYGDSISEGVLVNGSTGSFPNNDSDATKAVSQLLANNLDAEVGFRALGGGGWTTVGSGGVPPVYTPGNDSNSMWNKYSAGQSLLVDGKFSPEPDYIYMNHGTNDRSSSDEAVIAAVQGWLTDVRLAAPNAYIFLTVPFGQFKASAIYAAYDGYMAAHPGDSKVLVMDLGPAYAVGLDATTGANAKSVDGLHPNEAANIDLAAQLFSLVQEGLVADNLDLKVVREIDGQPITGLASSSFRFTGCGDTNIYRFTEVGEGVYRFGLKSGQACSYKVAADSYVDSASSETGLLQLNSITDKTSSPEVLNFKLKVSVNDEDGNIVAPDAITYGGNVADLQAGGDYYWRYNGTSSSLAIRASGYIDAEVTNPGLLDVAVSTSSQIVLTMGNFEAISQPILASSSVKGLVRQAIVEPPPVSATPSIGAFIPLSFIVKNAVEQIIAPIISPVKAIETSFKAEKPTTENKSVKINKAKSVKLFVFTRDLVVGKSGRDVYYLQKFLKQQGLLSNKITSYFGPMTKNALIKFQQSKRISPSKGYFGKLTKNFVKVSED